MVQHKPAPGADAERAQGVCSRCCNTLKRVLNTKLVSCLLWEQRAVLIYLSAGAVACRCCRWRVIAVVFCGAIYCLVELPRGHCRKSIYRGQRGGTMKGGSRAPLMLDAPQPSSAFIWAVKSSCNTKPAVLTQQMKVGNGELVHLFSSVLRLILMLIDSSNNRRFSLFNRCLASAERSRNGGGWEFFSPPCVSEPNQLCSREGFGFPIVNWLTVAPLGAPTNESISITFKGHIFCRWWSSIKRWKNKQKWQMKQSCRKFGSFLVCVKNTWVFDISVKQSREQDLENYMASYMDFLIFKLMNNVISFITVSAK